MSQTDMDYYGNERDELVQLVEAHQKVILDVGCGRGRMGARLKESDTSRRVIGIELNEDVAAEARKVLDMVITGDLQTLELPFAREQFDCIVFGDVLEHFADPLSILNKLKPYLHNQGTIVCSLPNMRHYAVLFRLLLHGWEYQDSGHFDKTHLRFFSLVSMKKLLSDAGFQPEHVRPRIVASRKMKLLNSLCFDALSDFLAFQYVLRARKVA